MNELEYYLDIKNGYVCCYDRDVEFFVFYSKKDQKWMKSNITFLQFCHDYDYREISFDEALILCDDVLPDDTYYEYLEMLATNGGIIKQRIISVVRERDANNTGITVDLYADGVKCRSLEDSQTVTFKLDFKDHVISCKTVPDLGLKTYELHVPYGAECYTFSLQFQNDELLLI